MKKFLQQTLQRVDGLYYILIADKDGVPFIKSEYSYLHQFILKLRRSNNVLKFQIML